MSPSLSEIGVQIELTKTSESVTNATTNDDMSLTDTSHSQEDANNVTTTTTTSTKKRPTTLTLSIPNRSSSNEPHSLGTVTDNSDIGSSSATAGISSPSSNVIPHEQYKTIKRLDIGFENVCYSTKVGIFRRDTKNILCGLTGHFRSGELTAIVGPSGAGKSTLLNVITAYKSFGYSGDFTVNGTPRDVKAFKPNVAFIAQDTSLQPQLTVKEAMHFSVNLKVGSHMTKAMKKERVQKILAALGLHESRHTRTGNLSGGQKKRLGIALELVNNPPVLVLDEPTTGLDSSMSTQLITLLKKLALEGRTVICTIHQPSALTFRMFDHLYAIAEGECIYAGGTDNLVPFLTDVELDCPTSYNPADYLMEIATNDYGKLNPKLVALMENGRNNDYRQRRTTARKAQMEALKKVDQMMAAGLMTPITAPVLSTPLLAQSPLRQLKPMPRIDELPNDVRDNWDIIDERQKTSNCCKPKKSKNRSPKHTLPLDPANLCHVEHIYATSFFRQLQLLLQRTFLILWRDSSLTTLRFAIHLLTGLLIGSLYYGIGNEAENAKNIHHYAFYTLMFIMYCAFSGILVKFPLEIPIVSREHFNRWYSLLAYYFAITLADIPIQIICTTLFVVPTYIMTDQPLEPMRITLFFLIVFMTALVAQSIGLAVGAALSVQLGAIFGQFFIFPFLQFSGFFLLEKDAPFYLRWLFDLSFLRHSTDGAMLAIFGYERKRLECHDTYCHYTRPKTLLKDLGMLHANYELAMIFMFVMFVLLRIVAFHVMSIRLRFFC